MKLLWHIIKKDIVREGWVLALWALLFLAQAGVGATVLWGDGADMNWIPKAQFGSMALIWLQMGMGFVLVTRWVHADSLLSTREFWMTRPMAGARLLGAKVAGVILVFGLGPVALLLPWWLACGLGTEDIAWVAGQTLAWQMVMILPALLISVVTDDLGRVLLGALVLVLAVAVWGSMWQALPAAKSKAAAGVIETRVWLAAAIAVGGIIWIVVRQFLARRLTSSLVMAVVCVGLVTAVAQLWPWDWTTSVNSAGPVASAKAELSFLRATTWRTERGNAPAIVEVSWKVSGLPEGLAARAENAAITWRWNDGVTYAREPKRFLRNDVVLYSFGSALVPFDYRADPETLRSRIEWVKEKRAQWIKQRGPGASGAKTVYDGELAGLEAFNRAGRSEAGAEAGLGVQMEVSPSLAAKMRATPSEMEGTLKFRLVRAELLQEIPWKEGQRAVVKGITLRLAAQEREGDEMVGFLVVSQASRQPWPSVLNAGGFRRLETADGEYRNGSLVALNRAQGDRVDVRTAYGSPVGIGGVSLSWQKLSMTEPWVTRGGKRVPRTQDWWEGTTLGIVAEKNLGWFTAKARVDGFLLEK